MMSRLSQISSALALIGIACYFVSGGLAWADEGRIPIYQQTTITQPGYYMLTRDVTASTGHAITVQANNVILDLNGRTIQATGPGGNYAVYILDGYTNTTIKNGRVVAVGSVIYSDPATPITALVDGVQVESAGNNAIVFRNTTQVDVRNCIVTATGGTAILVMNLSGATTLARIVNNKVTSSGSGGAGIQVENPFGGEIRSNVIRINGTSGNGITLSNGSSTTLGAVVIEGNDIAGGTAGVQLAAGVSGNLVRSNVMRGGTTNGILDAAGSDDNLILQNQISKYGSHGIWVQGSRSLIEGNVSNSNGTSGVVYGIFFSTGSSNVYKNNVTRGNFTGGIGGTANTNGGGNW